MCGSLMIHCLMEITHCSTTSSAHCTYIVMYDIVSFDVESTMAAVKDEGGTCAPHGRFSSPLQVTIRSFLTLIKLDFTMLVAIASSSSPPCAVARFVNDWRTLVLSRCVAPLECVNICSQNASGG